MGGRGGGGKQVRRLPQEQVIVDPETGRRMVAVREAPAGPTPPAGLHRHLL